MRNVWGARFVPRIWIGRVPTTDSIIFPNGHHFTARGQQHNEHLVPTNPIARPHYPQQNETKEASDY